MDWLDLVQWPAMLASIVAAWWIGARSAWRRKAGFRVFLLSNALWIIWGWHTQAYALIALQIALALTNLHGIRENESTARADEARR
ncbi:MAG: hypothetical protein QM766_26565 [Burkholderiaceae bacterium]